MYVRRMKALVFKARQVRLCDVPSPVPRAREARVRVRMAGVCATDLEIARGYMGFEGVLGHEFVGDVVDAPDAALLGTRVCGEINLACGDCGLCRRGLPRHCTHRTVLGIMGKDGAFAEELTLPVENLHRVPVHVPDEQAVFCEPLAAAFEILDQVTFQPGERALVLGDGRLGQLCARAISSAGVETTLVGRHRRKLALAEAAGITPLLLEDLTTEASFDVVVEATGSPSGLALALDCVRPRGTLVLKSTFAGRADIDSNRLVIDEISLVGSRCGPFPTALAALADGRVDPRPLIDETFPFADAEAAFARAGQPGVLKVLLEV